MVGPEPRREAQTAAPIGGVPRATAWTLGILAAIALGASMIVSMGFASVVWIPLILMGGGVMCTVWAARRRRQALEGRSAGDVKDPVHAHRSWPTKGITDDRLPEP